MLSVLLRCHMKSRELLCHCPHKHMNVVKENLLALHGSCNPRLFPTRVVVESNLQDCKERKVLEQEHEKNGDVVKVLELEQVQK